MIAGCLNKQLLCYFIPLAPSKGKVQDSLWDKSPVNFGHKMNPLEQILSKSDSCIIKEFTDLCEIKCPYGKDGQSSLINDY